MPRTSFFVFSVSARLASASPGSGSFKMNFKVSMPAVMASGLPESVPAW